MTTFRAHYRETGEPVRPGDIITSFRDDNWMFKYVTNGPISHGKIVVVPPGMGYTAGGEREFNPSAFPSLKIWAE